MPQHHLLHPSHDRPEVAASVLIAAIAGYAALTLAGRVRARRGQKHHAWMIWGGAAIGMGIAGMHFVGMLAMELPVDVAYESGRTLLSVVIAIVMLIVSASVVVLLGAIIAAFVDQKARRDITAAQRSLQEREAEAVMATELYRLLAEHATDMISTHRPDGSFDHAAPSWSEFVGVPINALIGRAS